MAYSAQTFVTNQVLTAAQMNQIETNITDYNQSLTTRGDLLYRDASGKARLPVGTSGQVLASDGTDPSWVSNVARIATGAYTGDGTTSQGITGVGFAPKYVKIWTRVTSDGAAVIIFETTDTIVDDNASGMSIAVAATALAGQTNQIISLDSDGFTVDDNGADENPNKSGQVYNYLAIG